MDFVQLWGCSLIIGIMLFINYIVTTKWAWYKGLIVFISFTIIMANALSYYLLYFN